ncbi:hypothetical protein [Mycobacterium paraense]|uniref:hypothetical protein n=1 Tax=Mycobacterium paraense TaxID=767916 RepID=UPI00114EE6AA|nr:hypothetical protein [Mycobacterium paraense]
MQIMIFSWFADAKSGRVGKFDSTCPNNGPRDGRAGAGEIAGEVRLGGPRKRNSVAAAPADPPVTPRVAARGDALGTNSGFPSGAEEIRKVENAARNHDLGSIKAE